MKTLSAEKIFQRPGSRSGLPAWTYDNAELTSLEIEQVFLRNWLFRHRASRVVAEESGHCGKSFICPFHGWSYNLDGSLRNIPRADTLDCEVWHGLIFIRFGGDGPSVEQMLAPAEEEVGLYRIEDMQSLGRSYDYRFDLDWKAVVDVDNEGYHVPIGHPELFDLVGSSYVDEDVLTVVSRIASSSSNAIASMWMRCRRTVTCPNRIVISGFTGACSQPSC
jgi:phenylpropionate dioxygenase-like ring-hydroxylating dioxygenase large terminal subunit